MRLGILGSGLEGGKLGTLFARAGHEVVFSYSRSEEKLQSLARAAGGKARAGTPAEAAREAEVIPFAVHWTRTDHVPRQARRSSRGRPRGEGRLRLQHRAERGAVRPGRRTSCIGGT
jgi:predicted dinucleotide-binding enzyme